MYIPPEIRSQLEEVERRSGHLWKFLDVAGKQSKIAELENQMTASNFWDSQKAAQKVISECNNYKNIVAPQVAFKRKLEDAKTLAEMIVESAEGTADAEMEELRKTASDLSRRCR
jgi:peptide chain release factor 2